VLTSPLRRLAALVSMAMLATLAVTPAAQATPQSNSPLRRGLPQNDTQIGFYAILMHYPVNSDIYRGFIEIRVYDNGRKYIKVCDRLGEDSEPTLQVDPTHGEPIEYQDPDGAVGSCLERDLWYPIRKFRMGLHDAGNATHAIYWWPWFNVPPLPHADF
jgi:hypothetical protein